MVVDKFEGCDTEGSRHTMAQLLCCKGLPMMEHVERIDVEFRGC